MGVLLGWLLSFGIVANSFDGTLGYEDAGVLFFYSLFGLIFPRTIGTSLSVIQAGSVLGGVISLFTGNSNSLFANILIFIVSFAGQHLIILARRNASASVGAESPFSRFKFPTLDRSQEINGGAFDFDYDLWDEHVENLEYPEIPIGQVLLKHKVDDSKIQDWQRTFLARFTDEAVLLSSPDDSKIAKHVSNTFEDNQRIPFSKISKVQIANSGLTSTELHIKIDGFESEVVFEVANSQKDSLLTLVRVWDSRNSVNKFRDLYNATRDDRMEMFMGRTGPALSVKERQLCNRLASQWTSINNDARKKLFEANGNMDYRYQGLYEFSASNAGKLRAVADPRRLFRLMFPLRLEYQSILHGQDLVRMGDDFDSSLHKLENDFQSLPEIKPTNFNELIEQTKIYFHNPEVKRMFTDVTSYIPRNFYN
jgi:hypothetical protein